MRMTLVKAGVAAVCLVLVLACASNLQQCGDSPALVPDNLRLYRDGHLYQSENANHSWSATTTNGVDRFELRPGDHWIGDLESGVNTVERNEFSGQDPMPFDTDIWLSFT